VDQCGAVSLALKAVDRSLLPQIRIIANQDLKRETAVQILSQLKEVDHLVQPL
jgi:hypothetical protein